MENQGLFTGIFTPFLTGLLVAAGVGAVIGLEREFNTHDKPAHIGGIRTFILVCLFGYLAGWTSSWGYPLVSAVAIAVFFLLIAVAYYAQAIKGNMGLTSEAAIAVTLLLGFIIAAGHIREALAVVVMMTVVLSLKEQLHGFVSRWTQDELFAFVKFAVMALLILPNLPDQNFGPEDLLNLREMGWIVVLVFSISFVGYMLLKFGDPHKGILWIAVIGGLFSSTMIAWVFSKSSRERPNLSPAFGAGIVLASSIMFVRVFALTALFAYPSALRLALPLLIMLLVSLVPARRVWLSNHGSPEAPHLTPGNPLDIKNALYFVVLYIAVTFLLFGSKLWLPPQMIYLSGAVAGIADIDAISISTAKWASVEASRHDQAALIILLAVISNSIFKLAVSLFNGAPELRKPVVLGFGLVLLVGFLSLAMWMFF